MGFSSLIPNRLQPPPFNQHEVRHDCPCCFGGRRCCRSSHQVLSYAAGAHNLYSPLAYSLGGHYGYNHYGYPAGAHALAYAAPAPVEVTYAHPAPISAPLPLAYAAPAPVELTYAHPAPISAPLPLTYAHPAPISAPTPLAYASPVAYAAPVAAAPVAYTTGHRVEATYEPVEQHGYQIVY